MIELPLGSELPELPNQPAVFLLWADQGKPYLARTNILQRRVARMVAKLGPAIRRIEYQLTGSKLEAHFLLWRLAKKHLGAEYRREIRLSLPPYVKLIRSNPFPRTCVTPRIGKSNAVWFGPFRNRASAQRFESEALDLFQLRRCQENLEPSPVHPGCMYGEMGKCLRPCQQIVGGGEYRHEAQRVAQFLESRGQSLLDAAATERERLSAEMDFEGAAMMHQRVQRIEGVIALADEMAHAIDHLDAVAVVPSVHADAVELGWMRGGYWQGFTHLDFTPADGRAVSLDARLREIVASVPHRRVKPRDRMEQIAILARWFHSSWCDGELLFIEDRDKLPYRKLVNAVSRVAARQRQQNPNSHSSESGSPPDPDR